MSKVHCISGITWKNSDSAAFKVYASTFRLGEMPNVYNGIGTVTYAPEAVKKHEDLMIRLWRKAHKGREGADLLRKLLKDIC